ncbi:MAG TPA: aspartyl/asparaginyl beta-hydroxylase domain-containing protein [Sphingomicrobium sp.]
MDTTQASLETVLHGGLQAMQNGQPEAARAAFEKVVAAGRATSQLWLLLADACAATGERDRAHEALDQVLSAEPRNIFALLLKGDLFSEQADDRAAIAFLQRAIATASAAPALPGDLPQRLAAARSKVAVLEARFDQHLAEKIKEAGIDHVPPRLAEAIRIATGKQDVYLQQPTSFYYPGLPQRAWYDPAEFTWLRPFEDAAEALAAEVRAALEERSGLTPYVENQADRPAGGHSLLNDPRWSAFHLLQNGRQVEENVRRCPLTMQMLATAPIPEIAGRSPMAMVSVLQPGTHIPPHTGMLNTRLICHVPLIVPDGCRLRVGGENRPVEFGKPMIFDDSIEHEAWNDGESERAVLLFEIWRPELSEDERRSLTAVFSSISTYGPDDA